MKNPIHLLFPMSGQGTRYQKAGYQQPKPLVPVNGIPMIERLLSCFPESWPCTFVLADNHLESDLPALLKKLRPEGKILTVPPHTEGPGRALLKGVSEIPEDHRILVSYCDYGMIWDAQAFEQMTQDTQCDAALLSYIGFHAHYLSSVKYAYSRMQGERVVEVREKGSFTNDRESEFASCGAYYFKNRDILKQALEYQYRNDISLGGEFYTSLTVQALLLSKPESLVKIFEIPYFFQWGTPEDLWIFEYWEKTFQASLKNENFQVEQLLMPMAGLGSRFKDLSSLPKPFIPVLGRQIYRRALESLPRSVSLPGIVALKEHQSFLKLEKNLKLLDRTPPGQALSTEEGLDLIIPNKSVLVSACDHELFVSSTRWKALESKKPDAVIFVVRGFPGAIRSPASYAYVKPVQMQDPISEVQAVSVKVPLSLTPERDLLLVGTFWFKSGELLKDAILSLKKRDIRVNNELYLDSVFEDLILQGRKVFLCETEGYINWGDPDSMSEALYWAEVFVGPKRARRQKFSGVFD